MIRKLVSLLFAGLLLSSTTILIAQDLIPALLDQGLKLYAARDYRGAADYLGQVIDMAKDHDQARFYLVYSLALSGNKEKALEHARILVTRHPDQKQYSDLVNQLQSEITKEKPKTETRTSATGVEKEVILGGYQSVDIVKPRVSTQTYDVKPIKPKTPVELAIEKIDESDNEGAEKLLTEILAKEPGNSDALHYIGVIRFNTGNFNF